jgi:hypothetical protein
VNIRGSPDAVFREARRPRFSGKTTDCGANPGKIRF